MSRQLRLTYTVCAMLLIASEARALTVAQRQSLLNSFYDINNVVTISIAMDPIEWETLKTEQPAGGKCNFDLLPGTERFPWRPTTSVTISGSSFLTTAQMFTGAEIRKKSYCGSLTTGTDDKPALKLKLPSSSDDIIGEHHFTLNNSKQDNSYIRQPLGYKLYGMAGLPHSRANFARVYVNGALVQNGIYVNVEPIRDTYVSNPDNHFSRTDGNLYEFEVGDDLVASRIPYIDVETISPYSNKADLIVASNQVASGLAGAIKVVDIDHFIKMYAMDFLLKNWDGFTISKNNTYFYNDASAVESPIANYGQVRFKLIPWGVDQILKPGRNFQISASSTLGALVRNDSAMLTQLRNQVQSYRDSVFGRDKQAGELKTFIQLMQSTLLSLGVNVSSQVAEIVRELKLARSAGFIFSGFSPSTGLYVLEKTTDDALHASNAELVGPARYEVVHQPLLESAGDRWFFLPPTDLTAHFRVWNESYGRWLHASRTAYTPYGHLSLYTIAEPDYSNMSQDYVVQAEGSASFSYSGYFRMYNARTGLHLRFGADDPTSSSGKQRVYQTDSSGASLLYWY